MEKKITSKVKPLVYFRQYLTIVNPLYDLSPRERDVLAYLLYLDYQYKDIPEKAREKVIFDYDSKISISKSKIMHYEKHLETLKYSKIFSYF